jgi:hypothetical protein
MGTQQVLAYHKYVLRAFATLIFQDLEAVGIPRPSVRGTWGDSIYLVFSRIPDAGAVALLLADLVKCESWQHVGLPSNFCVRISVHAAPVYAVFDYVTQSMVRVSGCLGVRVHWHLAIMPVIAVTSKWCWDRGH